MVKSDLVQALVERHRDLPRESLEVLVSCAFESMAGALLKGEDIEIRGFGSFKVKHRGPRWARNPRNGRLVFQPARRIIHFKAGQEMKELIQTLRGD
jgi:integration host factor subunit beta